MLAAKHPELEKPVQCVKYMSLGESWRTLMTRRLIRRLDENTWKDEIREDAIAEGLAEGLSKGLAKGKLEIAQKMKEMGDSIDKIAEVTGFSLDVIEKL